MKLLALWLILSTLLFSLTSFSAYRDPTAPPGKEAYSLVGASEASDFKLTSTLVAKGRQVAMINGEMVSVGEKVGVAKVESIKPGHVIIILNDKPVKLEVTPHSIRGYGK